MPFAGHPNVGTGCVLAGGPRQRTACCASRKSPDWSRSVERERRPAPPSPHRSRCPSALKCRSTCWPAASASRPDEVVTAAHRPVMAIGRQFLRRGRGDAGCADPRRAGDRALPRAPHGAVPALGPRRLPLYLYAHDGGHGLRARMFSPLSGTVEDAATGSAATPLAALLLSLGGRRGRATTSSQGVEMGRPSLLRATAQRARRRHPRQCRRRLRARTERRSFAIALGR